MEELTILPRLYPNKRIAIQLMCEDGETWGVLSANFVEVEIAEDEMCISAWNVPQERLDAFLATGKFVDTGKIVQAGYVESPIWRVVCPTLLESFARLRSGGQQS